jgi:dihydrofolate reductase
MKPFQAIAAMSENRVIGCGGKIPWHLPEDFRFFRKMTVGNIVVMGRKTFQAVGRPPPDRHTIVRSRSFSANPIGGERQFAATRFHPNPALLPG